MKVLYHLRCVTISAVSAVQMLDPREEIKVRKYSIAREELGKSREGDQTWLMYMTREVHD